MADAIAAVSSRLQVTLQYRDGGPVQEDILSGQYIGTGTNHDRPCYEKEGGETPVWIYFWDDRDGSDLSGWWLGNHVGADEVWAHSSSSGARPPEVGWRVVGTQAESDKQLTVCEIPDYEASEADVSDASERCSDVSESGLVWQLPAPWKAIRHGDVHYFWNPETEESVWEPPDGAVRTEDIPRTEYTICWEDAPRRWKPPPPWDAISHENRVYYWNAVTGESQWEPPPGSEPIDELPVDPSVAGRPSCAPESQSAAATHRKVTLEGAATERGPVRKVVLQGASRERRHMFGSDAGALPEEAAAELPRRSEKTVELRRREKVVCLRRRADVGVRSLLQSRSDGLPERRRRSPERSRERRRRRRRRSRSRSRPSRDADPRRGRSQSSARRGRSRADGRRARSDYREPRTQPPSLRPRRSQNSRSRSPPRLKPARPPAMPRVELVPRRDDETLLQSGPPLRPGHLELNYRNQSLGDETVLRWCKSEGSSKLKRMADGLLDCVDFSNTGLTDAGLDGVLRLLMESKRQVKRLMFFKNQISHASSICDFLRDQACGLRLSGGCKELHLSDCSLTRESVENMLECLLDFKKTSGRIRPHFWVRAERNGLKAYGEEMVKKFSERGLDICLVTRKERAQAPKDVDVHLYVE